jgi:hypothetical protein
MQPKGANDDARSDGNRPHGRVSAIHAHPGHAVFKVREPAGHVISFFSSHVSGQQV